MSVNAFLDQLHDPHSVRGLIVMINAVDTTSGTCTVDAGDGGGVLDGCPYYGATPIVGDLAVGLRFDNMIVIVGGNSGGLSSVVTGNGIGGVGSAASPVVAKTSNTWGQAALANLGSNSLIGNEIYVDSVGNLRSYPQFITAAAWDASPRNQSDPPSSYPLGQSIMTLTAVQAAAGGWPNGNSAVVVTIRRQEADGTIQWWYKNTSTPSQVEARYRSGGGNGGPWTPWVVAASDSGWIDITVNSGFAANNSTERPSVRLKNGIAYARGGWNNTGIAAINTNYTIGNVPAGYRPLVNLISRAGTNSGLASAGLWVQATGDVQVRTGPNLSSYYMFGGQSWPVD
jgi:hypothetical protein